MFRTAGLDVSFTASEGEPIVAAVDSSGPCSSWFAGDGQDRHAVRQHGRSRVQVKGPGVSAMSDPRIDAWARTLAYRALIRPEFSPVTSSRSRVMSQRARSWERSNR